MYGLTDDTLLNALLKQHQKGRTLQVMLEQSPYQSTNQNNKAIRAFDMQGMNWHGSIPSIRLIHQKTLIIDGRKALVMTFNFTQSTFKKARNFALILDKPQDVNEIEQHFAADWNHQPVYSQSAHLIWSPDDSRKKLMMLISQAKQSISIYAQQVSDYKIIGSLAKAARQGVRVNILTSNKLREKQANYLARAGVTIRYSDSLYIHAKVFMIDNQLAVIGSTNLTRASLDDNRELSVLTEDKNVIRLLNNTFAKDWEAATDNDSNPKPFKPNKRTLKQAVRLLKQLTNSL